MPNQYFQFKQFRVEQDKCAMKVCTDSCVFGAFVDVAEVQRILDIGTGTGLLSLMAAQRSKAEIDAVEINPEAQEQAKANFINSLWKDRLHLHPVSLQEFAKYNQLQYDVILSNPPFFLSSLKSPSAARNTARHTGELLYEDILSFTQQHLTPQGKLYLLLPPPEAAFFQRIATEHQLYLSETLQVFNQTNGKCIRHIQTYTFTPTAEPAVKVLHICEADAKTYTADFAELLKEYYLIF